MLAFWRWWRPAFSPRWWRELDRASWRIGCDNVTIKFPIQK